MQSNIDIFLSFYDYSDDAFFSDGDCAFGGSNTATQRLGAATAAGLPVPG